MVAGRYNYGKERNPLWGTCRYCCSYCPTKGKFWVEGNTVIPHWHECNPPKCTRESCDFCAWRTDPKTLVFIDIFGEEYAREIYKENVKRREKMVSNSSSDAKRLE